MLIRCATDRVSRWNNQCIIPGVLLNGPCDKRNLSHLQGTLLLTDILFPVFFAKIHFLVLLTNILFQRLYQHQLVILFPKSSSGSLSVCSVICQCQQPALKAQTRYSYTYFTLFDMECHFQRIKLKIQPSVEYNNVILSNVKYKMGRFREGYVISFTLKLVILPAWFSLLIKLSEQIIILTNCLCRYN